VSRLPLQMAAPALALQQRSQLSSELELELQQQMEEERLAAQCQDLGQPYLDYQMQYFQQNQQQQQQHPPPPQPPQPPADEPLLPLHWAAVSACEATSDCVLAWQQAQAALPVVCLLSSFWWWDMLVALLQFESVRCRLCAAMGWDADFQDADGAHSQLEPRCCSSHSSWPLHQVCPHFLFLQLKCILAASAKPSDRSNFKAA